MKLSDFRVLSFDCYGTLIDWENGILAALQPLMSRAGSQVPTRGGVLEAFARHESAQEIATPAMLYSEVLANVHNRLAEEWGVDHSSVEAETFGASVGSWPAFQDSREALELLAHDFTLVILSNVDRESFKGSQAQLGGNIFDHVYTAQDIGSYKPDPRNFQYLITKLAGLGFDNSEILHTAQSLYHDHVPANAAGLASAWIDRRHGAEGSGATKAPESIPHIDFRFTSMAEMADAYRRERARSTRLP